MDAKSPSLDPFFIEKGSIERKNTRDDKVFSKRNHKAKRKVENKIMTLKFSFASLFN